MFLFQSPEDPTAEGSFQAKGVYGFITELGTAINDALSPDKIQEFFLKLEDEAVKTSRKLSGSIQGYSDDLESTMFNVFKNTIKIGGSTQDVVNFAEQYADTTGRVTPLLDEQIIRSVKLSKEFGVSVKEIAAMTGEFTKLGLTQEHAINTMKKIGVEARKNMVNVGTLTKLVQENLKKSAAYSFKEGVKGLTEMAAKAQRLGVSLESSFSLFDKFMDPDNAVEFASEMSMLGGQFAAQFGDPFSNMGADVEELREKLTKAASASAVFNEKTGEFEIPRAGLQALRVFAEQSGESVEDLASIAKQSAKEMRIMNEVGFQPDVSEDDRKLLASMAEQKDGKWQVQLPGTKDWVEVAKVNSQNMKNFQDAAQNVMSDKTPEEINKNLLSTAERQVVVLNEIKTAIIREQPNGDNILKAAQNMIDVATTTIPPAITAVGGQIVQYILDGQTTLTTVLSDNLQDMIDAMITALDTYVFAPPVPTTPDTFSSPVSAGHFVSGPKGSFLTIPEDEILAAPNISEFVNSSMTAFNKLSELSKISAEEMKKSKAITESLGTNLEGIGDPFKNMTMANVQNKMESPVTKLQEVITTSNNNINVSGGANVSGSVDVKVSGNGVNMDDPKLSALIMSKVSEMMEERLSKGWKQKQGNIAS